jgi:hypothetical protein
MSVYQRAADLTRAQQRRFDAMHLTHVKAHEELVGQGQNDHNAYTGGGLSKKTLRSMGHPFAREGSADRGIKDKAKQKKFAGYGRRYAFQATDKNGKVVTQTKTQVQARGKVSPLPINKQTGELRRSFFKTNQAGKDRVVWMGFRSKHAKFVLSPTGTKKMIYRGFYSKSRNATGLDVGIIARRHRARSAALVQSVRARQRKI